MTNRNEVAHLEQQAIRDFIASDEIPSPWFPALVCNDKAEPKLSYYCALVPVDAVPRLIENSSGWEFAIGDGKPSIWHQGGSDPEDGYYPFGNGSGIEPIVLHRSFYNKRSSSVELSQEFRLYHNLFDDRANNRFLKCDDDGDEEVVVKYTDSTMEIRTELILEFCAAKQMALAIYVNCFAHSFESLDDLGLVEFVKDKKGELYEYTHSLRSWEAWGDEGWKSFSRVLGKKYVMPGPRPNILDNKPQQYHDFIIGSDANGNEIRHTCDPDQLADYFGANPEAPHYLTPVFFRNEALSKYYAEPEKYEVDDGLIRCMSLWTLRIDNDNDDYVVVWLGDLGTDLSEKQRSYWLSYNVPPVDRKISKTTITRALHGWFANPKKADLAFKLAYRLFREDFAKEKGWNFFHDLHEQDKYCFKALHVPLSENGAEFDGQLISLTKLLVDSLNEKEIAKGLSTLEVNDKGITKLNKLFFEQGIKDGQQHIDFLKKLQGLRSVSAAHRKGSNYEKIIEDLKLDNSGFRVVFSSLLQQATELLSFLRRVYEIPERELPPGIE
jgi:hypothetical protein